MMSKTSVPRGNARQSRAGERHRRTSGFRRPASGFSEAGSKKLFRITCSSVAPDHRHRLKAGSICVASQKACASDVVLEPAAWSLTPQFSGAARVTSGTRTPLFCPLSRLIFLTRFQFPAALGGGLHHLMGTQQYTCKWGMSIAHPYILYIKGLNRKNAPGKSLISTGMRGGRHPASGF